jgi:type II secretory ATPase GspE/PulE/Tfp pilus assembly ATPase PilB-like protein
MAPKQMANDFRLGELLIREGLVNDVQLARALARQKAQDNGLSLGQILVAQGCLTRQQLDSVLDTFGKRPQLGEVLVRHGAITHQQLAHALETQRKTRGTLGQILIKLRYVDDATMRQALAVQLDIPFIDLDRMAIDRGLARVINSSYARRHSVVPVAVAGGMLTVCMDDPTKRTLIDDLARATNKTITIVTASHESIRRALSRLYDDRSEAPADETLEILSEDQNAPKQSKYTVQSTSTQVDVLVRQLMTIAIRRRSSDVHIEMLADRVHIRLRVDGVLEYLEPGDLLDSCNRSAREVISRLKILAKLNIAERRRPQDGSFRVKVEQKGMNRSVDLRISVIPSHYGESLVIRILDEQNAPSSLDALCLPPAIAQKLRQLLQRPSGMLLVSGPTGSGKSTTLYACLMTLARPGIRILTAEDPIEYVFENVSQAEVNEQIGNTFASYLRAFLRHDPEAIMIGEIRDQETAEMAFRAAQTGHLLLSTLHTNTAAGAIARLMDLNVDPNAVASSLVGVVGQRLVRQICGKCKTTYEPSPQLLREFFVDRPPNLEFYKGVGCQSCNLTGYRGRLVVAELWIPSEDDIILINKRAPSEEIRANARRSTISMAENAWLRLREGSTSLEELARMLPYDAISEFRQQSRWTREPVAIAV